MSHIQLIMLTATFEFDWPDSVLDMFDTTEPVSQSSKQIFSFDCFIDTRSKMQGSYVFR